MKNIRFTKGVEDIRKFRLTTEEKQRVLRHVMSGNRATRVVPARIFAQDSWTVFSMQMWLRRHQPALAVAVLIIILGSGGGIVSAAERSLPGSAFYSLKINVNESVRDALAVTPAAKAAWEVKKIERRLGEAESLALRGELDETRQKEVVEQVNKHTEVYMKALAVAESDNQIEESEAVRTSYEAGIEGHAKVLSHIAVEGATSSRNSSEKLATAVRGESSGRPDPTNAGVSASLTFMTMSAPAKLQPPKAPATARSKVAAEVEYISAERADDKKDSDENDLDEKDGKNSDEKDSNESATDRVREKSYLRNRTNVKKIIASVNTHIKKAQKSGSPLHEKITNDVSELLTVATEAFAESERAYEHGDLDAARSHLRTAERASKEAQVISKQFNYFLENKEISRREDANRGRN